MTEFALGFGREPDTGWIIFPRDQQLRKGLFFPQEVNRHPAKMNLHLQQAIIEYVGGAKGEVMLDAFGGTGSLMLAALQGYRVILIDIEEGYHRLQLEAKEELEKQVPGAGSLVTLLQGDAMLLLPIPCNHIITSPPYASALHVRTVETKRMREKPNDKFAELDRQMNEYAKSFRNLARMNDFFYNQAMEKIYKLCYQSVLPGGTLSVVLKDRIENGKRVNLIGWADKVCQRAGFKLELWERWRPPGIQFTRINIMHGLTVIEDESVLIYRKEN